MGVFANVLGKQPGRPQLVGIAEVLGLPARQIDNEGPRFGGDDRLPSRPRAVIERRQNTSLSARRTQRSTVWCVTPMFVNRVKGQRLTVGEQHSRPLDRLAGSVRDRESRANRRSSSENANLTTRRGAAMIQKPRSMYP